MIVYEIVGGLVILTMIGLGAWKFSEILKHKKGRQK